MNSWSLLFATPLFAYRPPSFPLFGFYTPILLVPFAALLGRRFGVSGVVSIALGGLPFVISIGGPWGRIGGSPALYLIALAVAAIAAMRRPLIECLRWPQDERSARWLSFAAPFLLTLFIGIGYGGASSRELPVSFLFGFWFLGYFLLFVLGMRGVRAVALLLGFIAATSLSWALALNGVRMDPGGPVFAALYVVQPANILAALAMVSAGSATREFLGGRAVAAFWRRPYVAVVALVFLWFGPTPLARVPIGLESVRYLYFLQITAALPLAAFMAGLLRGARGTIFVTALVTCLMIVWAVAARGFELPTAQLGLETPFAAASYALMGAKVAEIRSGEVESRLLRNAMISLLLFVAALGATLDIVDGGGQIRLALAALFVVGVIAVLVAALRLRRALIARGLDTTSEKWAPFIAALGVVGASVVNLQTLGESLKQLWALVLLPLSVVSASAREGLRDYFGSRIDGEELTYLLVIAAFYLISLIIVVRALVRTGPKVYADARKIAAVVRDWRREAKSGVS